MKEQTWYDLETYKTMEKLNLQMMSVIQSGNRGSTNNVNAGLLCKIRNKKDKK